MQHLENINKQDMEKAVYQLLTELIKQTSLLDEQADYDPKTDSVTITLQQFYGASLAAMKHVLEQAYTAGFDAGDH